MTESFRQGAFEVRDTDAFPVGKRDRNKQMAREFSHNFEKYLELAKMTAADLARENTKRMKDNPDWMDLQPYMITRYRTGSQTPKINHLKQIADILGVTPHDLVPSYEGPTVSGGMRMGLKDIGGGKSLVDFCAVIDSSVARKIMVLLNSDPADVEKPSH